jgi:hypothetical protein
MNNNEKQINEDINIISKPKRGRKKKVNNNEIINEIINYYEIINNEYVINLIDEIILKSKYKIYNIDLNKKNIFLDDNNEQIDNFNNLCYLKDLNIIKNLLASLIFYFRGSLLNYITSKDNIEKSILYIFLLPIMTINNEFIIKVGYSKDLLKRKTQLENEFNIDNVYLIYVREIKNEAIEQNLHEDLRKSEYYYPIKKHINDKSKKNEKNIICIETYIFNYNLIIKIINKLNNIEMNDNYKKQVKLLELEQGPEKMKLDIEKMKLQVTLSNNEKDITLSNNEKDITLSNNEKNITLSNNEVIISNNKIKELELKIRLIELEKSLK